MRRYFRAVEGGCVDYTFVATDLDHAKRILDCSGCEVENDLEWSEIPADKASKIKVTDDDDGGVVSTPLDQCALGSWFCSEY